MNSNDDTVNTETENLIKTTNNLEVIVKIYNYDDCKVVTCPLTEDRIKRLKDFIIGLVHDQQLEEEKNGANASRV